jgi:hypothetical protein
MGRYDKIKVYNNGAFVQPKRIRVRRNGAWLDLGSNDSDIKRSLYVYKNGVKTRATLNKTITNYVGDTYREGGETILNGNTCFSPTTTKAPQGDFEFKAYIRRDTSGAKNIFKTYGVHDDSNHVYITLNDNGTITVNVNCSFGSYDDAVATTDNAITDNDWHYVKVYAPKGGTQYYVQLDEGTKKYASSLRAWQVYATNQLGDDGLHIRSDDFFLKTMDGWGNATSTEDAKANKNDSWSETTWE